MRQIILVAVPTLCLLNAVAQDRSSNRTPIKVETFPAVPIVRPSTTDNASSSLVAKMMPFVAPLVFENPDFKSTLVLANASTGATTATVTLFSVDGKKSKSEILAFTPHEKKR